MRIQVNPLWPRILSLDPRHSYPHRLTLLRLFGQQMLGDVGDEGHVRLSRDIPTFARDCSRGAWPLICSGDDQTILRSRDCDEEQLSLFADFAAECLLLDPGDDY